MERQKAFQAGEEHAWRFKMWSNLCKSLILSHSMQRAEVCDLQGRRRAARDGQFSHSMNLWRTQYCRPGFHFLTWTMWISLWTGLTDTWFYYGRFLGFERKEILFSFSPPTLLLRLHFWPPNVWIFSPYTVQFSRNNNLTQFWHYLPRVSIKCQRLKGSLPLNEHEFELTPGDSGGQRSLCAAV